MIDNNKIKKLELLLEYAIINIDTTSLLFDKDDIWKKIDTIIKITEIIDSHKNIGDNNTND
jgi:flagellin-specific chaperone FliS